MTGKRSALTCVTVLSSAISRNLFRFLEDKVQYLERNRLGLRREIDADLQPPAFQPFVFLQNIVGSQNIVDLVDVEDNEVNIANSDNIDVMLDLDVEDAEEDEPNDENELDSDENYYSSGSSSEDEDAGHNDGDYNPLPPLLLNDFFIDLNSSDSDDDWEFLKNFSCVE